MTSPPLSLLASILDGPNATELRRLLSEVLITDIEDLEAESATLYEISREYRTENEQYLSERLRAPVLRSSDFHQSALIDELLAILKELRINSIRDVDDMRHLFEHPDDLVRVKQILCNQPAILNIARRRSSPRQSAALSKDLRSLHLLSSSALQSEDGRGLLRKMQKALLEEKGALQEYVEALRENLDAQRDVRVEAERMHATAPVSVGDLQGILGRIKIELKEQSQRAAADAIGRNAAKGTKPLRVNGAPLAAIERRRNGTKSADELQSMFAEFNLLDASSPSIVRPSTTTFSSPVPPPIIKSSRPRSQSRLVRLPLPAQRDTIPSPRPPSVPGHTDGPARPRNVRLRRVMRRDEQANDDPGSLGQDPGHLLARDALPLLLL
ncbi:uncharacterized protein EV422DRAFT_544580 [Fimicolochytrium jonesii]|uniref:uncharacterized protein n=1 Tax=Fimicolochytrium jonesii TaxID=1396493 RepID=UPI0022FE8586|nr:uncharacterized protein EV422DRAFT_544580 [Fimicolochytrium jonesii]KAI8816723.1 hypothetical protein EV422DRAFT_544580 [Fimicolochytrium jonesii]